VGRVLGILAVGAAALTLAGPAAAATVPNEPVWGQEWAQHLLKMPEVWDLTTGSPDVVIATVDTGVNPLDDLRDALVPGWDFFAGDAVPRDTQGHGTHLASALVARGNNGTGTVGFCWQCKLMPVRVSQDGSATADLIAKGIHWAVDHGARIIVIGLNAGGAENPVEHEAVRYAFSKGVMVVASAGNTGNGDLRYPASFPEAVAVAATNDFDQLYFWSSRGPWIRLAAPGCMMILDAAVGPGTLCGTSFTPAAVAGVAALLYSLNPGLTMFQVLEALVSTAVPVDGIAGGRLDPLAAIAKLGLGKAAEAAVPAGGETGEGGQPATGGGAAFERRVDFRGGVMKRRIAWNVVLGKGRLEVQYQAALVEECQISVGNPRGELVLGLLPPGDPTLRSLTLYVRAGKHRVTVECAAPRRRSYTLAITAQRPVPKPARVGRR
jgi:subtilisin family serine protease